MDQNQAREEWGWQTSPVGSAGLRVDQTGARTDAWGYPWDGMTDEGIFVFEPGKERYTKRMEKVENDS